MSTIKVQCGCGQRYAFEVEPVQGRMPCTVVCPACGADGTSAANEFLAQNTPSQAEAATAARARLNEAPAAPMVHLAPTAVSHKAGAATATRLLPGQVERPQAESEARAKIFWGDPAEEVVKFLMRQNIPQDEASEIVDVLLEERAAALRSSGIGKIVTGAGMVCVPIATWCVFASVGVIPLKLFAITVMVGLWGAWKVVKGTVMVVSPKSEKGDVAEQ